jgi:hypothetical protein
MHPLFLAMTSFSKSRRRALSILQTRRTLLAVKHKSHVGTWELRIHPPNNIPKNVHLGRSRHRHPIRLISDTEDTARSPPRSKESTHTEGSENSMHKQLMTRSFIGKRYQF